MMDRMDREKDERREKMPLRNRKRVNVWSLLLLVDASYESNVATCDGR